MIPHNEDSNTVRSLYNLPSIADCKFNEQQVAFYLNIDRINLSQIQKTLLEIAYFEEWQFINEALTFPSQKVSEKTTSTNLDCLSRHLLSYHAQTCNPMRSTSLAGLWYSR